MQINSQLLKGDSIFTSFRAYGGHIPGLDLHLDRVLKQVSESYFSGRISVEELYNYYESSWRGELSNVGNEYLRLTFYPETSKVKYGVSDINLIVTKSSLPKINLKPITLSLVPSPYSEFYEPIKSGSYFPILNLKRKAISLGFDDIVCHINDTLTEASTSAIILEGENGFIFPEHKVNLKSITLELFKAYLETKKIPFRYQTVNCRELRSFKRAYLLNSISGARTIGQIDAISFRIDGNISQDFNKFLSRENHGK